MWHAINSNINIRDFWYSIMPKWQGGKGSDRRPMNINDKDMEDNWKRIFGKPEPKVKVRKITPAHAVTRVEEDKTKRIPRKEKHKSINILVE